LLDRESSRAGIGNENVVQKDLEVKSARMVMGKGKKQLRRRKDALDHKVEQGKTESLHLTEDSGSGKCKRKKRLVFLHAEGTSGHVDPFSQLKELQTPRSGKQR